MNVKSIKRTTTAKAVIVKAIPDALKAQLDGKTVNEAVEDGTITSLGNDKGEFIFDHADTNVSAQYAMVNGYGVIVSEGLTDNLDDTDVFDCQFTSGISTVPGDGFGKPWFRLGRPQGLNLGAAAKNLELLPE